MQIKGCIINRYIVKKSFSWPPVDTFHQTFFVKLWLVGCFGFNGPLRQYFSLYRAVSQREGERGEKGQMREKNVQTYPHPHLLQAQQALALLLSKLVGRPGTGRLPSTFAPPDHPSLSN